MLEDILHNAQQKAEQVEVYELKSRSTPVVFEANRLKSAEAKESHGIALRVVSHGRVGLSSATDFRQPNSLVDAALSVAGLGAEACFELPRPAITEDIATVDPAIEQQSVDESVRIGQGLIDRVRAFDPDIHCEVTVSCSSIEQRLINSKGFDAKYRKTLMSAGISGTLTRDTDILTIDEYMSWGQRLSSEQLDELADTVIKYFELARETAKISTGSYPVVFTPKGVASILLGCLQLALNGKVVLQGASPLGHRLGEQVFDARFSLWDDATIPFAPGSAPFDDEGTLCRRTPLIQEGIIQNFIYDLQTAGLAGRTSTGNGYRSLGSLPSPSYASLVFDEGQATLEEMISEIKTGVLIDQVMGAWAGNVISGDFSGNIHLGFKIESGRLAGRIKDCMVAGNVFEAMKRQLVAIGRPAVWEGGAVRLPPMCFASLPISSEE
jgi:PmbA protein